MFFSEIQSTEVGRIQSVEFRDCSSYRSLHEPSEKRTVSFASLHNYSNTIKALNRSLMNESKSFQLAFQSFRFSTCLRTL